MRFNKTSGHYPRHCPASLFFSHWLCTLFLVFIPIILQHTAMAAELTDLSGKTIHFDRPFTRIISLYGAHTENLASLGLDKEIIGRSGDDDYPPAITAKPEFSSENIEKFIAARPDLVLIRPMLQARHPELFTRLQKVGITVVSLQPTTIDEMYAYWRDLGKLTGKRQEAEAMIDAFTSGLAQVRKKFKAIPEDKRPKVYFEAIHEMMRTFSPDSISLFALKSAGGINIATDAIPRRSSNIADYGKERILSHAGDIDIFLAQNGRMNRVDKMTILEEPGFESIKAVREGRVFLIDEKEVSRPTLRLLQGIQQLYDIFYPTSG
ncbi:ABC transporter substrate-binding protein [Desulfopila sp. IMCC35006]|uniref:ABC transporter substrate-binding protein n=1 Tax=Desulfopila sp. IMCC35006 TaxID=2569542 RepID=UPI0010ABEF53|nr:ABC transporter substrate-binding protein [Desulfopila sp. IMCC35006]TKB28391.1 ABC transporter substrate-binding protein [Desulfopila sp. IMCC35006]